MCKDLFIVVILTICFPFCMHEFRGVPQHPPKMVRWNVFFHFGKKKSLSCECAQNVVYMMIPSNYLVALKPGSVQHNGLHTHTCYGEQNQTMKFDLLIVNYNASRLEHTMLFVLIRPIKYDLTDKFSSL